MSKVLVDRELLERALNWREGDAGDSGRHELMELLAQPAEAEGVEVVAWRRMEPMDNEFCDWEFYTKPEEASEPLVLQSAHLSALSAVTAERDALAEEHDRAWRRAGVAEQNVEALLARVAEVEALRKAAEPLEPVHGDQLPAIGSKVLIHLASCDAWVEHTVAGYYAWGDLDGDEYLHRVFVRVRDSAGYLNARLLRDVRPIDAALAAKEGCK